MRILAVGAHPDDLEILCAGTLAKYRARGDTVVMAHAAYGDKGHFTIPPEELTRIRRAEALAAAEVIGAECLELGFFDMEIENTPAERLRLVEVVRLTQPDVVLTHDPQDYNSDHLAISALVVQACFNASLPHILTEHPYVSKIPIVYFMDTLAGMHFQPYDYVDITTHMPQKLEMMSKHASQLVYLKEHDNYSALDAIETMGKFRGYQCGVKYAEGFKRYRVWGRNPPGYFLP